MTPTPKHIEEAQRLALLAANDINENCIEYNDLPESDELQTAIRERILTIIPLATLLAAQEELEKLGPRVDKLFEAHKQWTLAVSDERDQLRAELEKWKLGCETNADCYRTAVRAQDEQRLELIKLRAELAMANDAADKGKAGREAVKENAELRAERDEIENRTDEQWLDAIAANSKIAFGKEWETRDGESPQEGRQANISAIFSEIDNLRTHNAALLAVASRVSEWLKERDEKGYALRDAFEAPVIQALSTLEPLGIKV